LAGLALVDITSFETLYSHSPPDGFQTVSPGKGAAGGACAQGRPEHQAELRTCGETALDEAKPVRARPADEAGEGLHEEAEDQSGKGDP